MKRQIMTLSGLKLTSLNHSVVFLVVSLHPNSNCSNSYCRAKLRSVASDEECSKLNFTIRDVHNDNLVLRLMVYSAGGCCYGKVVLYERTVSVKKLFDAQEANLPLVSAFEENTLPSDKFTLRFDLGFSDPPKPVNNSCISIGFDPVL